MVTKKCVAEKLKIIYGKYAKDHMFRKLSGLNPHNAHIRLILYDMSGVWNIQIIFYKFRVVVEVFATEGNISQVYHLKGKMFFVVILTPPALGVLL